MVDAATLDLPEFDATDVTLQGDRFHEVVAELAATSWLARVPLGYLTLDREAGEFFLRTKSATFPGQMIAETFGVASTGPLREEIDNNILHIDGERHQRLRNVLNPFFTPRAAQRWRSVMAEIIADICADVIPAGRCDFVSAVAAPYPAQVIATVMGAPREDWPRLHEWSHWMQSQFDGPVLLNERDRIERAVAEFYEWCEALIARRREDAGDADDRNDLISLLLTAQSGPAALTEVDLRNLVLDVIAGGVDTTHAQLAHALRLFADHPDQWALLADRPELVPSAVEEVLRHEPVTPFGARILTADVTYRDVTFPAGTVILIGAVTGNKQDLAPTEFDITADRGNARLLTFGAGAHFCVGHNLARIELEEALGFLAPRMPGLRPDGDARFGTIQGIYGLESLPLAWDTSAS